jgi:hypothetical protein
MMAAPSVGRKSLTVCLLAAAIATGMPAMGIGSVLQLDNRESGDLHAVNGAEWRLFTDGVMGGVSVGSLAIEEVAGRSCLRMRGDVRLENNGGFIQVALDVDEEQRRSAAGYAGLLLDVHGNDEQYNVHLRTDGMRAPWQSFRATFTATPAWRTVKLPFSQFNAYRFDGAFDASTLRRIGIVAIGRAFTADLCISRLALYRD